MARWLRQNTQVCAGVGPFIKASDGFTAVIGADLVSGGCRAKKNAGNWGPVKSDVFTNEDGGGPFYEIALSAGDVDTLGLLRWTCYPSASSSIFQVWEDFMVVDPVTYDAYFGTGPMRADVNVWNHTSVASITTAGTIPVDTVYWNHGSVVGVVTAGAPSINVVSWAGSPVSAMPGAPGAVAGSVDVSSWGGKAVAAITTAGTIPVDVLYFNHGASASQAPVVANVTQWGSAAIAVGNAGIPAVDVLTWQHTTVASPVTAGTVPVDVMYVNHTASAGNAGLLSVNTVQWAGIAPNALVAGRMDSSIGAVAAGIIVSANVGQWLGTAVAAVVTGNAPSVNVVAVSDDPVTPANQRLWYKTFVCGAVSAGSPGPTTSSFITNLPSGSTDFYAEQLILFRTGDLASQSAVVRSYATAGKVITTDEAFVSAPNSGDQFLIIPSRTHTITQMASAVSLIKVSANVGSIATNVLVSANVGQWRGSVPAVLGSASTIPADVLYWNHGSATGIVTAGGPSVNVVTWAGAPITTPTTAGAIPVDVIYVNHNSAQGTLKADVMMIDHVSAASVTVSANVGSIGTGVLVSANVGQWLGSVPAALSGTLVQSLVAKMSAHVLDNSSISNDAYSKIIFWTGGSAGVGSTTTQVSSNNIRSMTDLYKGSIIIFTTGTCNGAMRRITGQTGNVVTFAALPFEVSAGDEFGIVATSWMEAPGGAAADVNVITWRGATPAVLNAGYVQSDVVMWAHSSASAMPGAPGAAGSVDVSSWGGRAVASITTAGAIPVDVVYWNHGSVAGIVTAGAPSTRLVAISNVSAEGVLQANMASISTNVLVSANVAQWRGTVPNVLNVGNVMADLQMWAHSSASAMPGAPGGVVGSVNVNMWAGTSVAAVVTAGWPQVEVASYVAGEAPLQPTVAGRTLDVSTGGEAGVDWNNVGTPGATVNLAATTLGLLGASAIGASSFAASAIDANALAASAVDEILDDTLEGSMTVRQALRIILSAVAGKLSGAATTNVLIRDVGDTKNRIDATVDAGGNRTVVTLDGT